MKYTISSLSFDWGKVKKLASMPADMGYEIFWECGSEDTWINTMNLINAEQKHPFSIHSPYFFVDLSLPGDTDRMFEELKRPFDVYHRFGGEFYVVHTFDHMTYPQDDAFEADCRKRSIDRLGRFNEICKENGVQMVAENIAFGGDERYLFNQEQFLDIFRQLPELNCLIDVGHAALADMDVYEMQKELQGRIKAYHIHDNNGKGDQHQRILTGIRDWDLFAKGVAEYTPDAVGVMEYMNCPDLTTYLEDRAAMEVLIAKYK